MCAGKNVFVYESERACVFVFVYIPQLQQELQHGGTGRAGVSPGLLSSSLSQVKPRYMYVTRCASALCVKTGCKQPVQGCCARSGRAVV